MGRKLTDDDYAAMADDYATNAPTAEEVVGDVEVADLAVLRHGRPPKGTASNGKTPTTSVRLPEDLREAMVKLADAEHVKLAEIIRRAVAEYVDRHRAAS